MKDKGFSAEIAALFGVTPHAVYLRLKEIGVKRRERGRPGLTFARETLVRLYFIEELPKKEIARKLAVSPTQIRTVFKTHSISRHSDEYIKLKYPALSRMGDRRNRCSADALPKLPLKNP